MAYCKRPYFGPPNLVITILFAIEMALGFCTAYPTKDASLEMRPKMIALQYLRTSFFLELPGLLPLERLSDASTDEFAAAVEASGKVLVAERAKNYSMSDYLDASERALERSCEKQRESKKGICARQAAGVTASDWAPPQIHSARAITRGISSRATISLSFFRFTRECAFR